MGSEGFSPPNYYIEFLNFCNSEHLVSVSEPVLVYPGVHTGFVVEWELIVDLNEGKYGAVVTTHSILGSVQKYHHYFYL